MLSTALVVGRASDGAYDVTVAPIVDLWGFGPGPAIDKPPSKEAIASLMLQVGQDNMRLDGEARRVRKLTKLSLDFSSLAKGYAVDRVAAWLAQQGIDRFLVEVGGEMRMSGMSGRGDPWRVAIERPDSAGRSVAAALSLTGVAVATVGLSIVARGFWDRVTAEKKVCKQAIKAAEQMAAEESALPDDGGNMD